MRRERKPRFSRRPVSIELIGGYPTEHLVIVVDAGRDDSEQQVERANEALEWIRSMPAYIAGLREDAEALDRDLMTLRGIVGRAVSRLADLEKKAVDEARKTVKEWPSTRWRIEDLPWPDDVDLDALERIYVAVHALAAPKACSHCGKDFVAVEGGRERKYCGLNCRVAAFRSRQRATGRGHDPSPASKGEDGSDRSTEGS
jgi:hypothetical protein